MREAARRAAFVPPTRRNNPGGDTDEGQTRSPDTVGGGRLCVAALLLEAERAGARVLAVLRDSLDSRSPVRGLLDQVQRDEGANAVVLYKTIRRLGGEASHETGAFLQKTLAIDGLTKRLRFVNRGQAWVVRKINEVLPLIDDDAACRVLENMRRSHLENIAACDALLAEEG